MVNQILNITLNSINSSSVAFLIFISISFFILSLTIIFLIERLKIISYENSQLKIKELQYEMNKKYIASIKEYIDELHLWKHNYQQHFNVIQCLASNYKYDELLDYCKKLNDAFIDFKTIITTGNTTIDALLSNKFTIAQLHQIKLDYEIFLPKEIPLPQIDLCIILSNILDNSIAACDNLYNENQRYIKILIKTKGNMFFINVSNSSNGNYKYHNKTLLSSKKELGHGIGIKEITHLVNKAKGFISFEAEKNSFTTFITVPMP